MSCHAWTIEDYQDNSYVKLWMPKTYSYHDDCYEFPYYDFLDPSSLESLLKACDDNLIEVYDISDYESEIKRSKEEFKDLAKTVIKKQFPNIQWEWCT